MLVVESKHTRDQNYVLTQSQMRKQSNLKEKQEMWSWLWAKGRCESLININSMCLINVDMVGFHNAAALALGWEMNIMYFKRKHEQWLNTN